MVALASGSGIPESHYLLENGVYTRPNCMIYLSATFVQIRKRFSVYDLASFPSCAAVEPFSHHAKPLASTFETAQAIARHRRIKRRRQCYQLLGYYGRLGYQFILGLAQGSMGKKTNIIACF